MRGLTVFQKPSDREIRPMRGRPMLGRPMRGPHVGILGMIFETATAVSTICMWLCLKS